MFLLGEGYIKAVEHYAASCKNVSSVSGKSSRYVKCAAAYFVAIMQYHMVVCHGIMALMMSRISSVRWTGDVPVGISTCLTQ